ncbi:hypothetical protein B5C34_11820 [Pacificimonas flava]|uniref:Uncharacterized protein n=2 Tax=Pacificimonas TaxID=1960290 RepID=A0A219B8E9_9SPHN|nr:MULTISPECIES: glycosyltransferase [Pacificimonas]MBZ6378650.1 glycosyltransferase [Pacificimonas aurantium]OWV34079.1 hypothetical protein B5C34_11820 [Pacificimonas flava]
MLRILTLTTLFPNPVQPALGNNVWRQLERVSALPDIEMTVIAPVPRFPLPGPGMPYADMRRIPDQREAGGMSIYHPRFVTVPATGWRTAGAAIAAAAVPLAKSLHRGNPFDLIAGEFFFPDAEAVLQAAKSLHVPHIMKARGSDIRFWSKKRTPRRQMVGAGRHAAAILAVSRALREDLISMGLARERIDVHYTGIDLEAFTARAGARRDPHLLISVGNLVPLKRHHLQIEALAHLPAYRLEIVGDGPERSALERLAKKKGVADRVSFLGRIAHAELPSRLAAAGALLHTSSSEGLANVWVEALACGTPVVTTRVGGAAELVDDRTGRLLPVSTSPFGVAKAVEEVAALVPGGAPFQKAAAPFSWERNLAQLQDIYARIVNPR